jgi:hypothetical protein
MIDYFEAIGRLISYPELRDEFLRLVPAASPEGLTTPQKNEAWHLDQRVRLDFSVDDYRDEVYLDVQEMFADVLAEGFISFPSAGELLWTYNRLTMLKKQKADVEVWYNTLVSLAEKSTQRLPGPSTAYFIALGAMIADKKFVDKLNNDSEDPEGLAEKFLRRLSEREIKQIKQLAGGDFGRTANELYVLLWDDACGPGLFMMAAPQYTSG